jgi:hypothetical protein
MSMNEQRADWIAHAISAFADEVMSGEISEDTISDIICNVGHYATRAIGLSKQDVLALYENGIGSWIAENDHPEGEPESNAYVQIVVG